MMNKIKFLILLSAILAALSACGSKDGPSDSPSQESSAGSTQPSGSAPLRDAAAEHSRGG